MPKKTKNGREVCMKILTRYGFEPKSTMGGYEYVVATNLMILEQLKKLNKEELSLLDV